MAEHRPIFAFLETAISTGKIGAGRPDRAPHASLPARLISTIPWKFLFFETVWSTLIVVATYFLSDSPESTLSGGYWKTRLSVSKSVTYGVGSSLFALLAFFIADSEKRYFNGQHTLHLIAADLVRLVRHLRQGYPEGMWHPGDHDRIVGHLVAYPIALKMAVRDEKDPSQLTPFLDEADAKDVVEKGLAAHCGTIARSYFSVAEPDGVPTFRKYCQPPAFNTGEASRILAMVTLDTLDALCGAVIRIAKVRPAAGFVNHLHVFLYIWLMFLPLSIVSTSGWYVLSSNLPSPFFSSLFFLLSTSPSENRATNISTL